MKREGITDGIIGVFYEVYNELGHGFPESVYDQTMAIALSERGLKVVQQFPIKVHFRGQPVGEFRADLMVNELVIVELNAAKCMESAFEAQQMKYPRATNVEVGLLMNFGPKPEFKRFVQGNDTERHKFLRILRQRRSMMTGIVASIADLRRRPEAAATTECANIYGALNSARRAGRRRVSNAGLNYDRPMPAYAETGTREKRFEVMRAGLFCILFTFRSV